MNSFYNQQTIAGEVTLSGTGVHSGKETNLTIRPAEENHGIKFRRLDLPGTSDIPALFKLVVDTSLATVIGGNGAIVSTIEHLMASFAGLGIDNALVEVDDYEMPIMDGSAAPFVYLLRSAGIREQKASRRCLKVVKPFSVSEKGKSVSVTPHEGLFVDYTIDFPHPLIGRQRLALEITAETFAAELAKARTFGFLREVELLRKNGLALGGSLENAVVLDEYEVVNPEGLRFEDEFVRHKMLDFIGDMALAPYPVQGRFTVLCSGHAMNNAFLRALCANGHVREEVAKGQGGEAQARDKQLSGRMVAAQATA